MLIGDKEFQVFWKKRSKTGDRKEARRLLKEVMENADMPAALSGQLAENQYLVSRFDADLAPHAAFWWQFSRLVNLAFPGESLSQEGSLAKKIHQFRYVISSQQAQYVRKHYRQAGQTDAQALAAYLRERGRLTYWVNESARLHNKLASLDGEMHFPGGQESYNIKILLARFHSEFILSSQGQFLNEIDAEIITENGIVNGASFNYGLMKRHWQLDVGPISKHDPVFRNRIAKVFKTPNPAKKRWGRGTPANYGRSFFNKDGLYGKDGRSRFQLVKQEIKQFKGEIARGRRKPPTS